MNYTTQQDVLDFVEDNNVKFVRFAFTDIFGTQKNIAVLAGDLPKALEDGVCFDGSAVPGFMQVEESDLVLRPDLSTLTILPWRPAEGRVMQFFCDIEQPGGKPFGGNCRGFLRQIARRFRQLGLVCNVGAECEFYLFETDERGRPTRIPLDLGGYLDVYPLDAAENLRRDICLTMEQMGLAPQHSHHESGHGQNEIDFHHASPLKTADNVMMFKQIARAVAGRNGLHASFMPKPLAGQAGSGLHINISLYRDRQNLFEGDIAPDSPAGSFMAGVLAHSRELTAFTNPLPNSYLRFGCDEAPRYVSWSRQNRSQLVRLPAVEGDNCRMELRSPDPRLQPLSCGGADPGGRAGRPGAPDGAVRAGQPQPVRAAARRGRRPGGWRPCPPPWKKRVAAAQASPFLAKYLPEGLAQRYYQQQLRRCAELRDAADPAEFERAQYFCAI